MKKEKLQNRFQKGINGGRYLINKRLKASTLVELLLTMIISGIIFLLVFDGVDIIKKFSHIVNNRVTAGQHMLYSHQLMEHLVENADSVVQREGRLLFYREGAVSDSVAIGESAFILETRGLRDTLFTGYVDYHIAPISDNASRMDSLFINCVINAKESIWLEYGLPPNRHTYLNN